MLVRNKNSFTLVEILLALAILGVGLVGILSVFVAGANSVRRAVEKTEASFIAQMTFENYKAQGYSSLDSLAGSGEQTLPTLQDASGNNVYSAYTRKITVTTSSNPSNLRKLSLKVEKAGNIIVIFDTYIAKYAP